ncbi:MAG: DUF4838 domain-containing protein [Lentisphaeria bacterium]|nr:DUF4838 domain-containing protein [Lentisphaeria bacterium]
MKKIFLMLLLLITAAAVFAKEVKIDLKNAVIVRPNKAYDYLASDFQKHLELIGGGKVPIVFTKQVPAGKYAFYVGIAPKGAKQDYKGEEGRYLVTDKAAYFYGDTFRYLGASHAVYTFLEEALDVKWPHVDDIIAVKRNPVIVSKLEGSFVPVLNIRGIRGQGIWNRRMRMGSHNPPQYGHAFTKWWNRFGKTHPEYFALNYGKRYPTQLGRNSNDVAQALAPGITEAIALCVSNEKVWDQIIADWKKAGMPEYINLCENDAPDQLSCHCENCMKLDVLTEEQKKDWLHALADRYIYFAKGVLAKAKKYRKDAKISMYAYNASQDAPRREKLPEDIVIGIVPTNFTMPSLVEYVSSWKNVGLKHFFYRPNRHYYYNMLSFPAGFHKHFFDVMQFMYKQGSIGFDYDSHKNINPTIQISDYLIAKGMQDPSKSYEYWMNDFLKAYGNAGKDVGKYFEYWRTQVWEKRIEKNINKITDVGICFNYTRGLVWLLKDYYKESDFVTAGNCLEEALKAKGITEDQKKLVQKLIDFNEHSRLMYNAIVKKTDNDSIALLKFRQKHGMKILDETEQYYGDVCGLKRVQDLAEFVPPFKETALFWRFKLDPKDVGVKENWFKDGRKILKWKDVMATNKNWENPYGHYKAISKEIRALTKNYDGIAWYATNITIPADWFGKRNIYLYFGAVDESCTVYVNGEKVHYRPYVNRDDWTTPFTVDITRFVKGNARTPQIIIVRVEDKAGAGGIWKRVWLVSKMKQ